MPTTSRQAALAVAVVLFAAAGRGVSDNGAEPEPTGASSTATAQATATNAQWASLVATHERDWREQAEKVEESCLDPATLIACTLGHETLRLKAQTIAIVIDGAATNLVI